MKVVAWGVGVLTLLATGGYLLVYVYRWEWHRALLVGVLFLATLVALTAALVLRRLAVLERRLAEATAPAGERSRILRRLHEAPTQERPFPWLGPDALERTHIFIPVLLGGGLVLSGTAWLVERLAGRSAQDGLEAELADDLGPVAFPAGPLVPTEAELLAAHDDLADDPLQRLLLGPGASASRP